MKNPHRSIQTLLASVSVSAFLATAGQAALVLEYQYTGTSGTAMPNPTADTSPTGPNASGTLVGTALYQNLNADGSAGTHLDLGSGGVVRLSGTGLSVLNGVTSATFTTNFRLNAANAADPRLFYVSTGTNIDGARAELRLNPESATVANSYTLRAGGRAADADTFQNVTTSAVTLNVGTWYSVSTMFDYANETISVSLDGTEIGSGSASAWTGGATSSTDSILAQFGANNAGARFNGDLDNTTITTIPEPSSAALLIGAVGMLGLIRRRAD